MKTFAPLSLIHALADFHQVGVLYILSAVSLKLKGWVLLYDDFIGKSRLLLIVFFLYRLKNLL